VEIASPYGAGMFSLTLDTAKNIGVGAVVVLAILALVIASVIRNVTVKIVTIALVVGIGVAIWTQRTALQNCADRAKARIELGDASGVVCTFFGKSVTVPTG
jgi:protein-S-isoprenylcysteine O-methyltransferase Ste14